LSIRSSRDRKRVKEEGKRGQIKESRRGNYSRDWEGRRIY